MKRMKKATKSASHKAKKKSSGRSYSRYFEIVEDDFLIISGASFLVLVLSVFLLFR